jgi:AcrR family transcriptional regulator
MKQKQTSVPKTAYPPNGATPDALIRAGRSLFARRGYDGCSVRAITHEAGANLGAITYHFGNKRGLYDAVVRTCMEPLAERVIAVAEGKGGSLERLSDVVRAYFDHLWTNPDLPFLMMQELAAGRMPPPGAQAALKRILGAITLIVLEGQTEGTIGGGDPVLLALSLIAQPVHLTVMRRAASAFAGIDQDDAETRARLVSHVVDFVTRGMAATPSPVRKRVERRRRREVR